MRFPQLSLLRLSSVALLSSFLPSTLAQGNVTSLVGTWSTGNGAVLTGKAFGDPTLSNTFNYPSVAGWSFSFTGDGHFEQAQFTWNSNATDPHCVQAVVIWQHGTYSFQPNGSITTDSSLVSGDGRIQVQDACASKTSVISYYNQPNLFASWAISIWRGKYMLQLSQYDGALMPRMYLVDADPSNYMFPTTPLSNSTNTLNGA